MRRRFTGWLVAAGECLWLLTAGFQTESRRSEVLSSFSDPWRQLPSVAFSWPFLLAFSFGVQQQITMHREKFETDANVRPLALGCRLVPYLLFCNLKPAFPPTCPVIPLIC